MAAARLRDRHRPRVLSTLALLRASIVYVGANVLLATIVPSMLGPPAVLTMLGLILAFPIIACILAIIFNRGHHRAPASIVASFCFLMLLIGFLNMAYFAWIFRGV
jgi:drug/metabolite transporter (DMT)-like permease